MKKPYNFADYNLIFDNKKNNNLYKVVVSIIIIVIIIIICKFKFYIYENNILLKEDDSYEINININSLDDISTSKKIIINKKKYDYKVLSYNELSNINGTIYESISLEINNLDYKGKILKCSFLKKEETILDMLLEFITGGQNAQIRRQ